MFTKEKRYFQGIRLVEVLWKAVASLLNRRIMAEIMYRDVLNRFWSGQGTETASLESNLLQQLMVKREAVLFEVFLDLQKAYDALDQDRCLELLGAYWFGPRTL